MLHIPHLVSPTKAKEAYVPSMTTQDNNESTDDRQTILSALLVIGALANLVLKS
jgi:hypothetical protein